jgi:hypothetical protein
MLTSVLKGRHSLEATQHRSVKLPQNPVFFLLLEKMSKAQKDVLFDVTFAIKKYII